MNEKRVIRDSVEKVVSKLKNEPVLRLNEKEITSLLYGELLSRFNTRIKMVLQSEPKTGKTRITKKMTAQVHMEGKIFKDFENDEKVGPVDIVILKSDRKMVVTKEPWKNGTPAPYFNSKDILGAVELKFFRSPNEKRRIPDRNAKFNEIASFARSVENLKTLNKWGIPKENLFMVVVYMYTPLGKPYPKQKEKEYEYKEVLLTK